MGVKNLSKILDPSMKTQVDFKSLNGKVIGFDAFIQLFQFLSSIRDVKGTNLTDSEGNVTNHLVGLIFRVCNLLQENIKPVFVFDGQSHELKSHEKEKRREARRLAEQSYKEAIARGDTERAAMFARRINKLTPEMIEDAKELLRGMGIPIIQAPGEGEAQAAQMAREGSVNAVGSQDYDTLLFGTPQLVRNLTTSRTRRTQSGVIKINPESYQLDAVLLSLQLNRDQLIDLGILLGTDFNPGFKGVGPKTALKWMRKYGDFETIQKNEEKVKAVEIDYTVVKNIFLKPDVNKHVTVNLDMQFNINRIYDLLQSKNFDLTRYKGVLEKTSRVLEKRKHETSVDDWF